VGPTGFYDTWRLPVVEAEGSPRVSSTGTSKLAVAVNLTVHFLLKSLTLMAIQCVPMDRPISFWLFWDSRIKRLVFWTSRGVYINTVSSVRRTGIP
jgi:hypothetical protein